MPMLLEYDPRHTEPRLGDLVEELGKLVRQGCIDLKGAFALIKFIQEQEYTNGRVHQLIELPPIEGIDKKVRRYLVTSIEESKQISDEEAKKRAKYKDIGAFSDVHRQVIAERHRERNNYTGIFAEVSRVSLARLAA